jgi:hygromycin-B 4-O-kinase
MYGDYLYDIAWFTFWWPWFPAWHTIDFKQEVRRHFDALGLDVSALARRLQCYEAHIGMAHLVYNSYTQGWDEFDKVATRMHTVFDGAQ